MKGVMDKQGRALLLGMVLYLGGVLTSPGAGPLVGENGDFENPGDTWMTGGGVPDGWTIANHPIEKGAGGTRGSPGTVGLNHRWHGSPHELGAGRSLYLMNPKGAIVEQQLKGTMSAGVTYRLRYGYFRYGHGQATVTASLKSGDTVLATQTFTGEGFPYRQWQVRELSYRALDRDDGLPVAASFELTGEGDVRLDGVRVFTITPELAALNRELENCTKRVAELPAGSDREKQKKAILVLALQRARYAGEAHLETECRTLLDEASAAIGKPIEDRPEPKLSKTLLPELKTVEGNPYLESLYKWAEEQLADPDRPFRKATEKFSPIDNFGLARQMGGDMCRYFWLAAHPQSRYRGNAELIARLFRRLHAYADAHQIHGHNYRSATNDFFAIGPTAQAMLMTRETYPDLLLPSDEAVWEGLMKQVNAFWMGEYRKVQEGAYRMGRYANRDVAVGNILFSCGTYLSDQDALDAARFLMVSQAENLYPDGAFAYIGTQNECLGYHSAVTGPLTTYYHLSGEEDVLEIVKRSEWYAPLTIEPGNVSDLWTAPSWKHVWIGCGPGGESVVALTGNRYGRGILDLQIAKRGASPSPLAAMWYQSGIKAAAPPDNYVIFDRNVLGPRGRFGRFSYAATLRVPNNGEPGNATIMGAMTTREDRETNVTPWEAVLTGIMPRVFVETTPEEKHHKRPDWAWLTCRDKSGVSAGRDWSALHTRYQLHTYGSSRKGPEVPWEGAQIWLCVRDRLFGLMEIAPQGEQQAFEVGLLGRIRHRGYKALSSDHWALGSLKLAVLEHNFASLRTAETTTAKSPELQIICSTRLLNESISGRRETNRGASELKTFTPDTPYYAIVEVSGGKVEPAAHVRRIANGALSGLTVRLGIDKVRDKVRDKVEFRESYTLLLNRGDGPLVANLGELGLEETGGWIHYSRGADNAPTQLKGKETVIPAGRHCVILSGLPETQASQAGWPTFETMVREMERNAGAREGRDVR